MIYTFYSYKGGVGRSMALANVACWFYDRGLRVLMIDWDLEAPGLETFFESDTDGSSDPNLKTNSAAQAGAKNCLGVVDILLQYKRLHAQLPFHELSGLVRSPSSEPPLNSQPLPQDVLQEHLSPISGFLYPIDKAQLERGRGAVSGGNSQGRQNQGSLMLLPAGLRAGEHFAHYVDGVQSFDWAEFYQSFHGEAYFNWFREQLSKHADVVLIDARTGVTEMGGVCTRQLADAVVSFCAPNEQNLKGVQAMVRSFVRPDVAKLRDEPVKIVIVPSRIDRQDSQKFGEFEKAFQLSLADVGNPFKPHGQNFWELKIPYITKYAYKEELAVGRADGVERELGDVYATLGAHLALLAPESSVIRRQCAGELQSRFPTMVPTVAVAYAGAASRECAEEWSRRIAARGISVWPGACDVDAQELRARLPRLRHLVVLASVETIASEGLRRMCHETRRQGIWMHVVTADPVAGTPWPVWLRPEQVHPERQEESLLRLLSSTSPAPRVPFMAPVTATEFVSPAERDELRALLISPDRSPRAIALWGLEGSRKLALAAAVCADEEVRARFDGGVLWLSLGLHPDLERQLGAVIAELAGPSAELGSSLENLGRDGGSSQSAAELISRLVRLVGTRQVLVVLDDVTSVNPDAGRLKDLRDLSNWTVLMTTRDRSVARILGVSVKVLKVSARPEVDDPESIAKSIDASLEELPDRIREFLARIASASDKLELDKLDRSFQASGDDVHKFVRLLNDHGLGDFDESSRVFQLHPVVRARLRQNAEALRSPPAVDQREQSPPPPPPGGDQSDDVDCGKAVKQARAILRGVSVASAELLELASTLRQSSQFSLARRLLHRLYNDKVGFARLDARQQLKLVQQLALCTYKDPDLPAYDRLNRAQEILVLDARLQTSSNPETLGLAGGIYKRKWELTGLKSHLEDSLAYYLRGSAVTADSPDYDFGYTAINASFVLDLLADQEQAGAFVDAAQMADGPQARRLQARRLREGLRAALPMLLDGSGSWLRTTWWYYATLIETCFGLGLYGEAREWLARGRALCIVPDWELESTARQLGSMAQLSPHAGAASEGATAVLRDLLSGNEAALRRTLVGKVGLALSGGGFRASLFHIGVLARLAELDVLRSVEVLSCVSGGSIIGAHYYLEVRNLLQSKADGDVTRDDYIEIVQRISREFLNGVQTNIRTSMVASLPASLRMIFDSKYTSTERLAELYDERLFQRVAGVDHNGPLYLDDLRILPKGDKSFDPKQHNWRRTAKVPALILNATTLNTGHNWQFTASFMGEPPSRIDTRVDGNERFRRMYYRDAPDGYKKLRLSRAVAASAGVPGLFEPLVFEGLYPDRVVRLVDGGVHDNQGVGALLEQDCIVMLVSDASGQMQTQRNPAGDRIGALLRSNGVLQSRLRVAEFQELDARRRSGLLRGLMFINLKKDLDVDPIDWVACDDPVVSSDEARPASHRGVLTSYGIRKDVQEKLAALRTDLDSFSDIEAYALMVSGYRMTDLEFPNSISGFAKQATDARPNWPFLCVEDEMRRERGSETNYKRMISVLTTGSQTAFKSWDVARNWRKTLVPVTIVAAAAVFLDLWLRRGFDVFQSIGIIVAFVLAVCVALFIALTGVATRCALYGGALLPARLHLRFLESRYLKAGRVESSAARTPEG